MNTYPVGRMGVLIAAGLLFLTNAVNAQQEQKQKWYDAIIVDGFFSVAYSTNFNHPDTPGNRYHVFDGIDRSISVDGVELSIRHDVARAGDAGFRFDMVAGSAVPRISRSAGLDIGDMDFHQIYILYRVGIGNGVDFIAGKFITPLGYEVIEGYDGYNFNYSRSLLFGYAIPFTHTGLKAVYAFSDQAAAQCWISNGWDNTVDNNTAKSLGMQLTFSPSAGMLFSLSGMTGPEKSGNNSERRNILDVVATVPLMNKLLVGINGDYGAEQNSAADGTNAMWKGAAGYARYSFSDQLALTLRAEQFDDPDGVRTGTRQTLREITLTPEYHLSPTCILRADLRFDSSNEKVFLMGREATDSQSTLGLNLICWF